MNCRSLFTKSQIITLLGPKFIKNVIQHNKITILLESEKLLIPQTSELIKWETTEITRKKLFMRGMRLDGHGDKPIIGAIMFDNCTIPTCKGILKTEQNIIACNTCKLEHCHLCFEVKQNDHVCDPDVIKNAFEIQNSTKPCPRCYTKIFKISGCSHMHCTRCNVHFDWTTGNVLSSSTNGHYRQEGQDGERLGACIDHVQTDSEHVPYDTLERKMADLYIPIMTVKKIKQLLYEDTKKIRRYCINEYNINSLNRDYRIKNDALRVKFIKHKIKVEYWGRHLFQNAQMLDLKLECGKIVNMYVDCINKIQSEIFNDNCTCILAIGQVSELLSFCNTCFECVNDEHYCGSEHTYRFTLPDEQSTIPIIRVEAKQKEIKPNLTSSIPIKSIQLRKYQLGHFARISEILSRQAYALDLSPLGSGKTYISSKYFQDNKFKQVYVICPASLKEKWLSVTREFGILAFVLTYNEITSIKYVQPKHGLLVRNDFTEERLLNGIQQIVNIVSFKASKKYTEKLNVPNGVLLIFDEIQNIRTEFSNRTHACRELMHGIIATQKFGNKCIMISGTPFDKNEQYLTFFKNINVQQSNIFQYNMQTGINHPVGYNEIIQYCKSLDTDNQFTNVILDAGAGVNRASALPHVANMFLSHVMHYNSSKMHIANIQTASLKNINSFCELGKDTELATQVIQKLIKLYDNTDQTVIRDVRMNMFEQLMLLESVKINTMADYAIQVLEAHPNNKVVISINYTDSSVQLMELLERYAPTLLSGKINTATRSKSINTFQEPNNKSRIIIANLRVICCGIDLDDKDGRFPRHVFISPTYSAINIHQLSFRFLRSTDTKSDTIIRYMYTKFGIETPGINKMTLPDHGIITISRGSIKKAKNQEQKILTFLTAKGDVMKRVSSERTVFPNEFENQLLLFGRCI